MSPDRNDPLSLAQAAAERAQRRAATQKERRAARDITRVLGRAASALAAGKVGRARDLLVGAAGIAAQLPGTPALQRNIDDALATLQPSAGWSWAERLNASFDFLRTGRTSDQVARGKYSNTMYYGILPNAERNRLRKAHLKAGRTAYPLSVIDEPYRLTDLKQAFELKPDVVAEALEELVADELMPFVQLLPQWMVRPIERGGWTLDQITAWMQRHAAAWRDLVAGVWLTFEHNEGPRPGVLHSGGLHPKTMKEGLRGDDWISALAGRAAGLFPVDVPILLHQTAGEHHDHRSWAAGGKDGEVTTERAVLAFQFHGWDPRPDAIVDYVHEDGTVERITSREAHERDWLHMLAHDYPVMAGEFGQSIGARVEYRDRDVFALGAHLQAMAAARGKPTGVGCGANP